MATIEEVRVGDAAEMAKTVTESDIALFAGVTGDFNPVHVDAVAAERSMFGERIAHGMLSAGFISAVLGMRLPGPGSVYLSQTLRFTKPVRIGDTVTARVEVLEVIAAKRRVRLATTCRNQRGETVVDGEAVVMIEQRG
jgi:3-hydroxybutyryl-CoA dehydratase